MTHDRHGLLAIHGSTQDECAGLRQDPGFA
jgi:hypothetical protein